MRVWVACIMVALAACGGGGGDDPDTANADTRTDTGDTQATEVAAEVEVDETADEVDDDATTIADADDVATVTTSEVVDDASPDTATDASVPLDRNCVFDVRTGNQHPDDARCRPCRRVIGTVTTEVTANLLWWGAYDPPIAARDVCEERYPGQVCTAEIIEAEVFFCQNNETDAWRIVWTDVVVVRLDEGTTPEVLRGPVAGVTLGPLAHEGGPFEIADAFVPGEWTIETGEARPVEITVNGPRPGQSCPVGSFEREPEGSATIEPCQNAATLYGPR